MPLHEVRAERHAVIRRHRRVLPHFEVGAELAHLEQEEDSHHAETSLVVHADHLQVEVVLRPVDAVDAK